ncbi:MAG: PH domain-containing protein [Planctomycetes bacterium]|nr:PH domain-containing protein [Planctomycetota bacterium]
MMDVDELKPPGAFARTLEPWLVLPTGAPHAPAGGLETRVFRAAGAYLKYRYLQLSLASLLAIPEIVGVFGGVLAWSFVAALILGSLIVMVTVVIFTFLFAAIRLEYDLRQYLITDRALRIRGGAIVVSEVTITYANIQDVEISQGPLQRWFGIADLIVHTAGGSATTKKDGGGGMSHRGTLAGIAKPHELRDYILQRLRIYRDSGLGDPDDARAHSAHATGGQGDDALASALAELRGASLALQSAAAK